MHCHHLNVSYCSASGGLSSSQEMLWRVEMRDGVGPWKRGDHPHQRTPGRVWGVCVFSNGCKGEEGTSSMASSKVEDGRNNIY